jgi:ribonuclease HI
MLNKRRNIRVMQVNTRKVGTVHDNALNYGHYDNADVILIQEPWTTINPKNNKTKSHGAYHCFSPVTTWNSADTRPRVLTYVRKGRGLRPSMLHHPTSRDVITLKLHDHTIMNIYRERGKTQIFETLEDMDIAPNTIIAGDFNSLHHAWQPGCKPTASAARLYDWINDNDLDIYNTPGIPTHEAGNTIDLTIGNVPLVQSVVAPHLHSGSDHSTLVFTIPLFNPIIPPPKRLYLPLDKYGDFKEAVHKLAKNLPTTIDNEEDAESHAISLIALLTTALEKTGRKSRPDGKSAKWWNDECRALGTVFHQAHKEDPIGGETKALYKEWRSATRTAKAKMWADLIENIKKEQDLWKICGWYKAKSQFEGTPIEGDEAQIITDPLEKAAYLRRKLLERTRTEDDIPSPWNPTCPERSIDWDFYVPLAEAEHALIGARNTTPGADGITVDMLRCAWPAIAERVRYFFQRCIELGYHPRAFRQADVIMIPKPNRDPSTHKGWRPISLLSCLGKGLERLIAKRLAWAATIYGILPPEIAGALPKKSAVDIVGAVTHDIEVELYKKRVATLITMDVQGAFDAVLRNRLVHRMIEQGWPFQVARWVYYFMTDRSCTVSHEGAKTESARLGSLLPQGSPTSPVLFLLDLAPAHTFGPPHSRSGYADDCGILITGASLEETTQVAQQTLNETVAWGRQNGIAFDPEKTELIHFTRQRNPPNPTIQHDDKTIAPGQTIKWLGIHLDSTLSFKHHIEERTASARAVANHIRGLSKVHKGAPPAAIQKAIRAVVVTKLLYGSEVWWPGQTRYGAKRHNRDWPQVQNGLGEQLDKCQITLNHAIRGCLPVWKTTPKEALWREASIPPVRILLDIARRRHALRLGSLPAEHPLVNRILNYRSQRDRGNPARPTILTSAGSLADQFPRPVSYEPKHHDGPALRFDDKKKAAVAFTKWADSVDPKHTVVYTDGSRLSQRGDPHTALGVGYGYAIYRDRQLVHAGCRPLDRAEVFDAEAEGAAAGVAKASSLYPQDPITVCLDNSAVLYGLHGNPSASSQAAFLSFYRTAETHLAEVDIRWAPGHTGIIGNEMADLLAKRGAQSAPPTRHPPTRSYVKRQLGIQNRADYEGWWYRNQPPKYARWGLSTSLKQTPELATLSRIELHHLLAARSGHGDFASYHERFKHEDAVLECTCGKRKTPTHIFSCQKARRRKRWIPPRGGIETAIGTQWSNFIQRAKATDFFQDICPRY